MSFISPKDAAYLETPINIANGGTNSNTPLTNSSIMVSNGSSIIQGNTGTSSQVLHGDLSFGLVDLSSGVTGTLPVANGGSGVVDLASGVTGTLPVSNGGSGQTSFTSGQLLIGNTGGTLTKATLTAGDNIYILNGDSGSIEIGVTGDIGGGGPSNDTFYSFKEFMDNFPNFFISGTSMITDMTWACVSSGSITTMYVTGNIGFIQYPQIIIGSGTTEGYIMLHANHPFNISDGVLDMRFDFKINQANANNDVFLGLLRDGAVPPTVGDNFYGVWFDGATSKSYFRFKNDGGSDSTTTYEADGTGYTNNRVYRINIDPAGNTTMYMDGTLLHTVATASIITAVDCLPNITFYKNYAGDLTIYPRSFKITQELTTPRY